MEMNALIIVLKVTFGWNSWMLSLGRESIHHAGRISRYPGSKNKQKNMNNQTLDPPPMALCNED